TADWVAAQRLYRSHCRAAFRADPAYGMLSTSVDTRRQQYTGGKLTHYGDSLNGADLQGGLGSCTRAFPTTLFGLKVSKRDTARQLALVVACFVSRLPTRRACPRTPEEIQTH